MGVIVSAVQVWMGVHDAMGMAMAMAVEQVSLVQQTFVCKNVLGRPLSGNASILQHDAAVCDVFDDVVALYFIVRIFTRRGEPCT